MHNTYCLTDFALAMAVLAALFLLAAHVEYLSNL